MIWRGTDRCNALESSPNCPPTTPRSMEKLSSGPWCQKVQGLLLWTIRGWYCSSCDAGDGKLVEPTPCPCPCEQFPPGRFYWTLKISEYGWVSELMRFQWGVGVSPYPRTVRGCVTNLEYSDPPLLLCSTSNVHLSSPCLSVLLYCSVGSLLFVCPLPFLHTPNCCKQTITGKFEVFVLLGIKYEVSCFLWENDWVTLLQKQRYPKHSCACFFFFFSNLLGVSVMYPTLS